MNDKLRATMNKFKAYLKLFGYLNLIIGVVVGFGYMGKYTAGVVGYIFANTDSIVLRLYTLFLYCFIGASILAFIIPKIKILDKILKCIDEISD